MYSALERSIIARLALIRDDHGVMVRALPGKVSEWSAPADQGWVTLVFRRVDEPDAGRALGTSSSLYWDLTYELDIRSVDLRGTGGLYQIINDSIALLRDWKPDEAIESIKIAGIEHSAPIENYWVGVLTITAKVWQVSTVDDGLPPPPLLVEATVISEVRPIV